jgi:5-oxoprolinase (ATP-hydrolysing) subunit B
MTFGAPNCARFGESGLVLSADEASLRVQRRLWAVARAARSWRSVREAVVGAGNLTMLFDRVETTYAALEAAVLESWNDAVYVDEPVSEVSIPVHYGGDDGPDLEEIARACGCSADAVVAMHVRGNYVVSFVGFVPGFAYLDGLDPLLQVPRLARPRTHVPAGSVAIAERYSAVYPFDSPGGWRVIGRTDLRMFDPARDPFTLLAPGDTVRFIAQ